ncbi:MAG TPA: hypothetical protein PKJ84_10530 [Anaerolineales bacterium]|nr:hypothetical protein [Anaerolineales bacterium]
MSEIKIGIPLHGKMAARAFHQPSFRQRLAEGGFKPLYFLSPTYFRAFDFDPEQYFELQVEQYDEQYQKHFLLQQLRMLRRFVVVTETTDLRFRELIESKLFDATLVGMAAQMSFVAALRHIPGMGGVLGWLERNLYVTHAHDEKFNKHQITCVLTPGMGNYGFWNENQFAHEAQRLGIPTFTAITNYDNIVNMGYRGFEPVCLGVWSKQMADEAMKLHGYPANKMEITGPVQYDRFMTPLPQTREEFLKSLNLDPSKKTILFAGGVNINHYFDIYRVFVEQKAKVWREPFNFIVRPYPHPKLMGSPAWAVLENLFKQSGAYISNPGSIDASGDRTAEFRVDLAFDEGPDELNYLLRYSDVMVNYFSTISLEAAICDLPTIHIGYDPYTFGLRFSVTTGFLQRQTHNRRPLRLAAARVAKSESELFDALENYLGDRTLDRDARRIYAEAECGELDGGAGRRLVNMIKNRI